MSRVDIERAVHLMTLPPPDGQPHPWPSPIPILPDQRIGVPVGEADSAEPQPCDEAELDDQQEILQARALAGFLAANLEHPRPLGFVLELIGLAFDLEPGCAARLFWRAHERGYVSLHEGFVHIDRTPTRP